MATTGCTIRERRDDDLPVLAAALVRVHAQDGYPVEGVADPIGWLEHPQALRSWTAVLDEAPIGQVTLTEADPDGDAARAWTEQTGGSAADLAIVVRLFVDPDHRSVSAGRLLMVTALDHARRVGRSVALDVMAKDQAAVRLYERLGGRQIGEVTHHHGDGLTEPAIVLDFPSVAQSSQRG